LVHLYVFQRPKISRTQSRSFLENYDDEWPCNDNDDSKNNNDNNKNNNVSKNIPENMHHTKTLPYSVAAAVRVFI